MERIDEYFLDRARVYLSVSNQYGSVCSLRQYGNDPKVVTIVGNCAIPVLAALVVAFGNLMSKQIKIMTEDEE